MSLFGKRRLRARACAAVALLLFAAPFLAAVAVSAGAAAPGPAPSVASEAPVLEFAPPKPGVWIDPAERAAHELSYSPRTRTPLTATPTAYSPSIGDHKSITILAEFSDIAHSAYGKTYYDDILNFNGTSRVSARTFFYENSLGNYTITTTVTNWVTLPNTQAYYDSNTGRLASDAAKEADSQVDFSQFDEDGNGYVDNLMIIHSGGDQAAGCTPNCIWSHSSGWGAAVYLDGKWVGRDYATVADFGHARGDNVGVWIHEFGHLALNLPDLYDTCGSNEGLSLYEMMAAGSWYYSHFSAWSKEYLGWIDPYVPVFNLDPYAIYPATDVGRYNAVKVTTNYTNEYFLLEMRLGSGSNRYDSAIPYSGLIIYHVDSNTVNAYLGGNWVECDTNHKGIDIEEVGTQDLDSYGGGGTYSNDVWVSNPTGFTPTSTPNSNLYVNNGNYVTGIKVYNISAVLAGGGTHMTFSLNTGRINYGFSGRVLGSSEREAVPGSSVTYPVEFTTFASSGDTLTLSLEGANQTQGSLDRTTLVLPPFGAATANLTVTVPGPSSAGDPAWVQVRGTSTTQTDYSFLVPTLTRAAQVYSLEVWGEVNATQTPGATWPMTLNVRNAGNGPDNVTVTALFDPTQIVVSVVTQPGILLRGGSVAVPFEVFVQPTVLYGTAIPVSFDVRYGPPSAYRDVIFPATITAGKYPVLSIEVAAVGVNYLNPGQPQVFDLTVHNQGNYRSTIDFIASAPQGITVVFDLPSIEVGAYSDGVLSATVTALHDTAAWTAGEVWFTATLSDGLAAGATSMTVQVTQRFELALTGETYFEAAPGGNALFNLVAVNLGNGRDNTTVEYLPAFSLWNASLSESAVALDTSAGGRSHNFEFRVTVPAGASGNLLQEFTITVFSQQGGVSISLPVYILVLPVYAFEATVEAAQGPISSTESATFLISFRNRGNVRDSYSVTIGGLPEGWTTEFAEGGVATVLAKGVAQMTLIVHPLATAPADRYDFQIFASSEGNLSRPTVLELNVSILAHREIQVTATPVDGEVRPGATVTVSLLIRNLGNVHEVVYLEGAGPFASVGVDPLQLTVPAYEERVVTVVVILKGDQVAGYTPLVITAAAVDNASVTSESTVGIQVQKVEAAPSTLPGAEAVAAVVAIAGVAALAAAASRKRR